MSAEAQYSRLSCAVSGRDPFHPLTMPFEKFTYVGLDGSAVWACAA